MTWTPLPSRDGSAMGSARDPDVGPMSIVSLGPPYPGASLVPPAVIPAPPLLPDSANDVLVARTLVSTYRQAAESRTKERCFVLARVDLVRSRHYAPLVACGLLLREKKIPPAAWAAWAIDLWRQHEKGVPPISLVWSKERVAKRSGWFRKEASSYVGGVVLYGPAHRDLIVRWERMARDLYRLEDPSGAAAVVERHFPGDAFDGHVRRAREEAEAKQRELRDLVEQGAWLW